MLDKEKKRKDECCIMKSHGTWKKQDKIKIKTIILKTHTVLDDLVPMLSKIAGISFKNRVQQNVI